MERFLRFIICVYLLLCPFYVFPSGLPQPADFVAAVGVSVFLFSGKFRTVTKLPVVKILALFVWVVIAVNLSHWFYHYAIRGIPNPMYFSPLFYIYNALFFLLFLFVLTKSNIKNNNTIALFILISLSLQLTLAIMGIHGGAKDVEYIARPSIFFNNPNQLGYYGLLMLAIFATLPSSYRSNKVVILLVLFITSYLVFLSGSRAALGGIVVLGGVIFYSEGFKLQASSIFLFLVVLISLPFFLQSEFVQERLSLIEDRNQRYSSTEISQAEVRGYDRFWLHPEYIIYGAGEGLNIRFDSYHNKEMHSGIGVLLFGYGILGFILFFTFIYRAIERRILVGIMLLLPVLLYNITHQGLRSSLFWMLIASIYIVTSSPKYHSKSNKRHVQSTS